MYRRTDVLMPTSTSRSRRWMIVSARNSSTPKWAKAVASRGISETRHVLRVARVHPGRGHLRDEGRAALLHGQVQAGRGALLRLVEQDAVHERGLEGAGRPGDKDDLAARDAAAQPSVQAHDVGRNLVRGLGQRGNPSPAPDGTERSAIALGSIDIFVERFCCGPSRRSKRILKLARTLLPRSHARDGGRRLSIRG